MKNCIIVCGHLGTTLKAAQMLARTLGDETVIFDTLNDTPPSFGQFDNIIFGSNVRYLKLNKRFRKWASRLKNVPQRQFAYICGATASNADKYIAKARKALTGARSIRFVGGYLDETGAKGFALNVIRSVRAGLLEDGLPLPKLIKKEIERLAADIAGGGR